MVDSILESRWRGGKLDLPSVNRDDQGISSFSLRIAPQIVERAGNGSVGGITGSTPSSWTGDDFNGCRRRARSILDGHIVLNGTATLDTFRRSTCSRASSPCARPDHPATQRIRANT
jgi:flagellar biosynthesis/type III secretory pathway ATPase